MPQPSTPHKDRAKKAAEAKERAAAKRQAQREAESNARVDHYWRTGEIARPGADDVAPNGGEPHTGVVTDVTHPPEAERGPAEQGDALLTEIEAFLGGFLIYPSDDARVAHALWVAHTHMMPLWESTPRIAFLSVEPASGKSRALEVSELLVPRPMEAVNMSPSALFRSVGSEDGLPTILHDEIDTVFGPKAKENEEIRGLLNAGHRRGAKTYRTVMHGKVPKVEAIEAFSAVALAGLGWLPDTILSRSIVVRMRKRKQGENIKPFRRRVYEKGGHALRDRLSRWAQDVKVNEWPEMPAGIEDRAADVWEALLAVADAAGGDWPRKAREAAVALVKAAREVEPSLGIRLLADLKQIFGEAKEMPTEAILGALHNLKEAPWNDLKGRPLNDRGLAQRLRPYEVKPKVLSGGAQRGYLRVDFYDAWERYIPPLPPAGSVTSVTNEKKQSPFNGEAVTDNVTDDGSVTCASVTPLFVTDTLTPDVTNLAPKPPNDPNEINNVTDVTLVTRLAAGGRGFVCAQCGAGPANRPTWRCADRAGH